MRFPSLTLLLACVMVVAGCGNAPNKSTSGKHNFQVKKVTDYLYEVTLDYDFDYSFSKPFTEKYRPNLPACSSISIGNFRGRNLDWYYEDGSDFVVHTTKREGRHASLAISSMPQISNSIAGDGQYHAEYEFIPFSSLDGINDAGVCVNLNVVPFQEYGKWQMKTETPDDDMMEFIAPRMILDKCATLTDVIPVLEKYDWFCVGNEFETHLMVSGPRSADDKTITTVVFEYVPFQDGDKTYRRLCCVSNDPKDIVIVGGDESRFHNCNADFLIMTNFNLWKFDASLDRKGRLLSAGEHPAGFERYEILEAAAGTAVDILGGAENLLSQHVQDIMYAVNYSNMYNIYQDNFWYSESCPDLITRDEIINLTESQRSPHGNMENLYKGKDNKFVDGYKEMLLTWGNRDRSVKSSLWETLHTSIYNYETLTLHVGVREGSVYYEYKL